MQSKRSGNKSIDLYRRLILLILFGLFAIFTLVVVIIYSVGSIDPSTWIGKVQQFILNLYPNILIIPFTFLFGYLFFGPIQKADQEANEEQLLEKIKVAFGSALENSFIEKMNELLIPMVQSTLMTTLQVSDSIQQMGIIAVKPHINYGDLRDRIVRSEDRVCFSDTSLSLKEFEAVFQLIGRNQVSLRILLLDPKSPMAKERLMNLYGSQKKEDLQHRLRVNIAAIAALRKKLSLENMELRLHSTMPALQIFICDNEATIGFYFYGKDSQVSPQLEVLMKDKKGECTPLGKLIEDEFETRWNLATPVPR